MPLSDGDCLDNAILEYGECWRVRWMLASAVPGYYAQCLRSMFPEQVKFWFERAEVVKMMIDPFRSSCHQAKWNDGWWISPPPKAVTTRQCTPNSALEERQMSEMTKISKHVSQAKIIRPYLHYYLCIFYQTHPLLSTCEMIEYYFGIHFWVKIFWASRA